MIDDPSNFGELNVSMITWPICGGRHYKGLIFLDHCNIIVDDI